MRHSNIFILLIFFSVRILSAECVFEKDTLLLIDIDIRSSENYPKFGLGVVKKFDCTKISLKDSDSFVNSFFTQGHLVPNFLNYDYVINETIRITGDSSLMSYIGQGQKLLNDAYINSREIVIYLESGEIVFLRITKITGLFYRFNFENVILPTISNDFIVDPKILNLIYVPILINEFKKPSRRSLKILFFECGYR